MRGMRWVVWLALLAVAGTASAGRLVELAVVDRDTGALLPVHWQAGQAWVAGTPGQRYAVRLQNRSGGRVLAVLSVDGVNAVSGETAAGDQRGYVLAPWGSTEVTGWRKSLDQVAAFEFTALGDSYAARTGRPGNVGVIGVAVYEERRLPVWRDDWVGGERRRGPSDPSRVPGAVPAPQAEAPRKSLAESGAADAAAPASGAERRALARPSEPLGTGHGAREWSRVRETQFERATAAPAEVLAIRYDSWANLAALGILPRPSPRYGQHHPQPFPGGFVPDP